MKERLFSFFKMNRLIPVIFCLFFATSIYAQNREVKGIVTGALAKHNASSFGSKFPILFPN